jgi:hypothetical protein
MKIADLNTGTGQLRDAIDLLQRTWSEARQKWNDANARNIDENHLQLLRSELAAAFPAIEQLAAVLDQAGRECGPSP